ncbi:MAG: hypothetical protein M0C28_23395 [Candidatus Moduliflexus flocculans]|nr:hypothetical protein [Candidatus Moduliflexus flocculans]
MQGLDPKAIEKAADLLTGARFVLFLGLGGSAIVAQDAYHKLMRTGHPLRRARGFPYAADGGLPGGTRRRRPPRLPHGGQQGRSRDRGRAPAPRCRHRSHEFLSAHSPVQDGRRAPAFRRASSPYSIEAFSARSGPAGRRGRALCRGDAAPRRGRVARPGGHEIRHRETAGPERSEPRENLKMNMRRWRMATEAVSGLVGLARDRAREDCP